MTSAPSQDDSSRSDRRLDDETAGSFVGHYRLLQRLGEGGFGTVWSAQQEEPVRRVVAVKILKAGMDSKQVVTRFGTERQALAVMDHPCIAKVLDGGESDSGRPYFVMELVKGVPITRFCDDQRMTPRARRRAGPRAVSSRRASARRAGDRRFPE